MNSVFKVSIIFSFLFLSITILAQHDFKKGYIILPKSTDTIHGWVDDGASMHNASACNFKKDSASAVTDYQATQLKAYGFDHNIHFVSKIITAESVASFYFLEYLVTGSTLNLYYMNYKGFHRYYIEKENAISELTNDDVSYIENGISYTKKSEKYKGVLRFLMQDAPSLVSEIQQTQLNRKSLIAIVKKYHETTQKSYTLYPIKKEQVVHRKLRINYGAVFGFNSSKTRLGSSVQIYEYYHELVPTLFSQPQLLRTNFPGIRNSAKTGFYIFNVSPGIFCNLNKYGKNSFQVEISYFRYTFKTDNFSITMNKLSVPIMYRRGFGYNSKREFFANAGLCVGINLKPQFDGLYVTYDRTVGEGSNAQHETVTDYADSKNTSVTTANFGLMGGLGVNFDLTKKNSMELEVRTGTSRYNFSNNMDDGHILIRTGIRLWTNALVARISF